MKKFSTIFLLCLLGIWGCSNTKNVSRVDSDQDINLSGRWNDSDSRLVSDEMINDALSRSWLKNYTEEHGRKPTIIVGTVKNKTSEHISAETFIKDMEREILNSNRARIVQAGQAREELRKERDDQQDYASLSTMKKWGLERGADFVLQGTINSITDSNKKQKLIFYQVDLELTDLENNEKVWIGTKKIRKVVK
ncbi:penicillin-binding protein activator LpoB [Fodinibius sp. SL11]|uniref:penicillin-binding protein activator LpoB n=1 Tax=Fodinibius sp. SL11 TaxID=3425690 RepID=UPI003F88067D